MRNISTLRKAKGWTQIDLAREAGITQTSISKAERGAGGVSVRILQEIADALEVPIYQLFLGEDDAEETPETLEYQINPVIVGARLKHLREVHAIESETFANSIGMDQSSYAKVERGEKPLKAGTALAIAERWGVTMDFLYRGRLVDLDAKLSDALMMPRTQRQR